MEYLDGAEMHYANMKQIIIMQKCAVRLIDNSKTMTQRDPIFLKYNILKINDFVDFDQATFMLSTHMASYQIHLKMSLTS